MERRGEERREGDTANGAAAATVPAVSDDERERERERDGRRGAESATIR